MSDIRMEVLCEPTGDRADRFDDILTPQALAFLTELHDAFSGERHTRLAARLARRRAIGSGHNLRFLPQTASIRADRTWKVAGAGPGLADRRVEITGPTDAKTAINALNSGANVWLADHEDATSPTWANIIGGQVNLAEAVRGTLTYEGDGRRYAIESGDRPTIVFRPRGWHLVEKHLRYTDPAGASQPASASLVDAGLYAFHNANALIAGGSGLYYYLPKIESHLEARLWDEVFAFTEQRMGLPYGSTRATVLIETITAAFEMEEILFELRDHCAGLNAGRWDYIFSIIKTFRERGPRFVLPDRSSIAMTVPFMRAYTDLLVATCHRRGAYAIGGMSAFIPQRSDPAATARALDKVAEDKRREAESGFDGSWVAHPGLIDTARSAFDAVLGARDSQVDRLREDVSVSAEQLLDLRIDADITDAGVRANISVALRYLRSWLAGTGAVAIDGLMEDVATAEISRSQLWQWLRYRCVTREGTVVTPALVARWLAEELARTEGAEDAAAVLREVAFEEDYPAFLTVGAYACRLVEPRRVQA